MEDPVNCRCGHAFEREAIVSWMARGNPCCPISRKDLAWEDLVPNHVLAERIEKWKWQKEHEDWMHPEKNLLQQASSYNCNSSATHRDDNNDKKDDCSEVDLEMNAIHPSFPAAQPPQKKHQLYAASQIYQAVPTGMILLPQEQALQDSLRNRKEENRRKRRRQALICSTVVVLCLGVTVAAIRFLAQVLQQQEKNDQEDLDDGEV
jgi:U-box domain